jgi:NAD(P)-dependent dehydrogenase (short-subunit alcohol dehydrogenase family)
MLHRLSTQERAGLLRAIPLGHTAEPAEIAGTVRFLLSPSAASITGAVIDVNGGMWVG